MSDLEYGVKDGIATIRLNRPEKMNAFTDAMIREWRERVIEARNDDAVRVLVLTGTGRGFCSGKDLGDRAVGQSAERTPISRKNHLRAGPQSVGLAMLDFDKPSICAVNGAATGAGLDMALMCDMRTAARSARFTEAYIRLGLMPGNGGCWYLPRIVGMPRAFEMFLTGDFLSAEEAERIGLVNHVYDDDKLMEETYRIAARLAAQPPELARLIKRALYQSANTDLRTSLELVSSHMGIVGTMEDAHEAIAAFKEKRAPVFKGR